MMRMAGEQKIELLEGTLADAKKHLTEVYPGVSFDKVPVGFVNGKAVAQDWDNVVLSDGDEVMFVMPIAGR